MMLRSFHTSKKNKSKEMLKFAEQYSKAYESLSFTAFTNVRQLYDSLITVMIHNESEMLPDFYHEDLKQLEWFITHL